MSYKLVIAEKPSVAQSIAKVSWQRLQEAKRLEDCWIPLSAIIKGGSQERVFSYFLMLRMYITS